MLSLNALANCVYTPGSVLPLEYVVGSSTSNKSHVVLSVCIDHVFLPFTKSQTLRVDILYPLASELGLPNKAILKLYDRRWIDDRRFDEQPWSPARELAAQARWKAIASGEIEDDFERMSEDDYNELHEEEQYRRLCKKRFENEHEAYRRLDTLQGTAIPQCYGAVVVSPSSGGNDIQASLVYGLILEYVDGTCLTDVDPSNHDYASPSHFLMTTVYLLPSYGVIHADMRSNNILITPTRAVLIDFGQAIIRQADMDDEAWAERVGDEDEVEALHRILHSREVRDRTPYSPARGPYGGFHFNRNIERERESWRRRWYTEVSPMTYAAAGTPSSKHDRMDEPAKWKMKESVRTWLDTRPALPGAFMILRPGSPYWKERFSYDRRRETI